MQTYGRFLFEFLDQFFSGFKDVFNGLVSGVQKTFNIPKYTTIIQSYKTEFSAPEWVLVAVAITALVLVIGIAALLIFLFVKIVYNVYKVIAWKDLIFL